MRRGSGAVAVEWAKGGPAVANPRKRVPENAPGDFFVDSTCIDCDTCRQIAPAVFSEATGTSFVKAQPAAAAYRRLALQALLACPTGSIGCLGDDDVKAVMDDFPLPVEGPVYYCGYNSPKSYGGNSYFVRHPAGNWLIDSPKFVAPLVPRLESLGGVAHVFLTHLDDVADADRHAAHFYARRIVHRDELPSQPEAEVVLDGAGPWELAPGFLAIATPGHTRGHCALLFEDRFLFTGDHLAGTGTLTGCRRPRTTAGTRGRSRSSRCGGWPTTASSGCCPATASGSACPPPRCGRESCGWQRRWAGEPPTPHEFGAGRIGVESPSGSCHSPPASAPVGRLSTKSQRLPYRSRNTATVPYPSSLGPSANRTPRPVISR